MDDRAQHRDERRGGCDLASVGRRCALARVDGDIEHIELTGPFAAGSMIAMTPRDQGPVQLRLSDVVEGERFVDEAEVAGTVVRTMHRIEALGEERVRVVYRLEASGPAAEAIGPAISADFDDTLKALVEHAGR